MPCFFKIPRWHAPSPPLLPDGRPVTPLCLSLDTALILNKLDNHKQLSTQYGPTLILSKCWVTLIVIIIMQPCVWNAFIMQQSSIKRDNMSLKKVVGH